MTPLKLLSPVARTSKTDSSSKFAEKNGKKTSPGAVEEKEAQVAEQSDRRAVVAGQADRPVGRSGGSNGSDAETCTQGRDRKYVYCI